MTYTEDEICDLYRHAKDKKQEFYILMDLTRADRETLTEILLSHGCLGVSKAICQRCRHDYDKINRCPRCPSCEREVSEMRLKVKKLQTMRNFRKAQGNIAVARMDAEIEELKRRIRNDAGRKSN